MEVSLVEANHRMTSLLLYSVGSKSLNPLHTQRIWVAGGGVHWGLQALSHTNVSYFIHCFYPRLNFIWCIFFVWCLFNIIGMILWFFIIRSFFFIIRSFNAVKWLILCHILTHILVHAQSSPTLCSPMDCSPPGSPDHGIFQARILE